MAGEAAVLFLRPIRCSLAGINLEVGEAKENRDRLYAAVHFNTITSLSPDDLNQRWICSDCNCHISLTRIRDMPPYDAKTVSQLDNTIKEWQRAHVSIQVTLHYTGRPQIHEDDRIVLHLVPDGDSSLAGLVDEPHDLLVGQAPTNYHVSLTDPGKIHWFKHQPPTTLACPAVAPSSDSSSSSNTTCLALSVCSANPSESVSERISTSLYHSGASSARVAGSRIRNRESRARVTNVFHTSQWRRWCVEEPGTWRPLAASSTPCTEEPKTWRSMTASSTLLENRAWELCK